MVYLSQKILSVYACFFLFLFVYLLNAFSRHRFSNKDPSMAKSHLTSMLRFLSGCALLYLQTTNLDQVFFSSAGVCKSKGLKLRLLGCCCCCLSLFLLLLFLLQELESIILRMFANLSSQVVTSVHIKLVTIALTLPLIALQNYNKSQYLLSHFCFFFFVGLNQ